MFQTVYLGPTMSGQGITITTSTIYNGPTPPDIAARQESDEDFAALFVPVSNVAEARIDIRTGDTFLAECYQNVFKKYINGKRGGQ